MCYPFQETRGLIAAMLAGSEGSHTSEEPQVETKSPDRDSVLDGIDHSLESSSEGDPSPQQLPQVRPGVRHLPPAHLPVATGNQPQVHTGVGNGPQLDVSPGFRPGVSPGNRQGVDPPYHNTSLPQDSVPSSRSAHNSAAVSRDVSADQNTSAGDLSPSPLLRKKHGSCSNQLSTSFNGHLSGEIPHQMVVRSPTQQPNTNLENLRDTSLPQELKTPARETSLQHGNLGGNVVKHGVKSNGLTTSYQQQNLSGNTCTKHGSLSGKRPQGETSCNGKQTPQSTSHGYGSRGMKPTVIPQEHAGQRFRVAPPHQV